MKTKYWLTNPSFQIDGCLKILNERDFYAVNDIFVHKMLSFRLPAMAWILSLSHTQKLSPLCSHTQSSDVYIFVFLALFFLILYSNFPTYSFSSLCSTPPSLHPLYHIHSVCVSVYLAAHDFHTEYVFEHLLFVRRCTHYLFSANNFFTLLLWKYWK